jgi:phytoene/squalene synthetase
MKVLFDNISLQISANLTRYYSTSFSLGIRLLHKSIRNPIYAIYGFVRLGDEIVDSFHDYNKEKLFFKFKEEVYNSIDEKISLNPILNSFQNVVNNYHIDRELIDSFLHSMELDLSKKKYEYTGYKDYILGSAEVVGLMCLRVFCEGQDDLYNKLKEYAMKLGSAYQKINFIRDIKADYYTLGRTYFPGINIEKFNDADKNDIEIDIDKDFAAGLTGIKMLPPKSKLGVFLSYTYYYALLKKVKRTPANVLMRRRLRINNFSKFLLFFWAWLKFKIGII